MEAAAKQCKGCSTEHPLSAFYRNARKLDGRENKCKSCWDNGRKLIRIAKHNEKYYDSVLADPKATKRCTGCNRVKRYKLFSRRKATGDGFNHHCKSCVKKQRKKREKGNWVRFGLTKDEYYSLHENQSGRCAICGHSPTDGERNLCIDHCHEVGHVRGLLCSQCNMAIGLMKDDPAIALSAADYLFKVQGHEG